MHDEAFFNKVYACWMGKNIGGTLGAPLEGRMELLDIKGYTQIFVEAVENDDLDLQLVNLHCVEQNGGNVDMRLLSREWAEHVHFQYDEYGHALTNIRRGLASPLSGCYNNFFVDCMGSPIRSEIWAVICAGMPDLAAYYAYQDASVDHAGGEGIYGEIFFAVLESMAFTNQNKFHLINTALAYLPANCAVRKAVELLLQCHAEGKSWVEARQAIIDNFAGDNFTYAPVNIAFTLVGWLYEEGFTKQMLTTLNCGYDTDCTVATLGSLLGILYGREYIDDYWTAPLGEKIIVSTPITGFEAPKTITELTQRSIAANKLVQLHYSMQKNKQAFCIPYQSRVEVFKLPLNAMQQHDLHVEIYRPNTGASVAPQACCDFLVKIKNLQNVSQTLQLSACMEGKESSTEEQVCLELQPDEQKEWKFALQCPAEKKPLYHAGLCIRRFLNGVCWNGEYLHLSILPTMDWVAHINGTQQTVHTYENRLGREQLDVSSCETLAFETVISFEDAGDAVLKLACASPLKIWVDGELKVHCPVKTTVIPAYHRADPRKSVPLQNSTGKHHIRIEIDDADSFEEMYFMPVSPHQYWAYRIDTTFEAP